ALLGPAAAAGDDDRHELDRFLKGQRARAGAEHLDEGHELGTKRVISIGESERELDFGAIEMDRAEAAKGVVNGADAYTHAGAVREVHHIAPGIGAGLHDLEARAEERLDRFQRVDAVALPRLAGEARDPAKLPE